MELLTEGRLEPATGSRDAAGRPRFPARPGERRIPLIGYRPVRVRITRPWGLTDPAAEPMRMQYVPGHLRRLHPKSSPSEAQRVAFRDHCRRLGKADGWELPDGYTFVTGHTRGRWRAPTTSATGTFLTGEPVIGKPANPPQNGAPIHPRPATALSRGRRCPRPTCRSRAWRLWPRH
ncbi:hypothetical protein SHIRM173S_12237 [Streptomyces hirsutus]